MPQLPRQMSTPNLEEDKLSVGVVDWMITAECNCKCLFCYADADVKCNSIDLRKVLLHFKKLNVKTVCITGGEPLLHPQVADIIETLTRNGMQILLSTNGILYYKYANLLESHISKLSLPLDGYDSESNMYGGRSSESFNAVKSILEYYKNRPRNFRIKIGTVLHKKNCSYEHLEKMADLINKYNIEIWKIYEVIPEAKGELNRESLELTAFQKNMVPKLIQCISERANTQTIFLPREKRSSAYFMILPDGSVSVPKKLNGKYGKQIIGNVSKDSPIYIYKEWMKTIDISNYNKNNITRVKLQ